MLTLRAAPPDNSRKRRLAAWTSPVAVPQRWAAAAFAICAIFAGGVALFSTNDLHRRWGIVASCAYLAASLAVLAWRSRGLDLALLLSVAGALITPLFWNAATGRRQPEVTVISRSALQLVHHQSPYQSVASLATVHDPNAYNPYLPVMSLFGVPRALFGPGVVTDPRIWFGLAFLIFFGLAVAVGGTDVPILALMCLGLALLWRHPHYILAGMALGVASAAKATAWPAVIIAVILLGVRDGRRATLVFLGSALVSCAALVGPVAVIWPSALIENTIMFPLGLAPIKSAAASPLPGHLIAQTGHTGHEIALALLVLAGLALIVWLVIRPPRTVPAAAWWLIIGLSLMFTLAPATRFGYFIYPGALLLWLEVSLLGRRQAAADTAGLSNRSDEE